MRIPSLSYLRVFGSPRRPAAAPAAQPVNKEKKAAVRALRKTAANAVRREPTLEPVTLPESIIRERQVMAIEACSAAGMAEMGPALCKLAHQRGLTPEGFTAEVQRHLELRRIAQEAHQRAKAAGGASLIDVDSVVERLVASGAGLEAAAAELAALEAQSAALPRADYATVYGDGTVESVRAKVHERAAAPAGSPGQRLAQLLGEDTRRREILGDALVNPASPATGRRSGANVEYGAYRATVAALLDAEAGVMEQHWGGPAAAPPAAAATAPGHSGYFRCEASPSLAPRREQDR